MKHARNSFRIIAGQWRGRTLHFTDLPDLRPTMDRIRETLFNWLQTDIVGARCLDLFSGTGALGFEALSRGAAAVTAVEMSSEAVTVLQSNARMLNAEDLQVVQADVKTWLNKAPKQRFNIVFLDPPYSEALLEHSCQLLASSGWLTDSALIYLEDRHPLTALKLPASWQALKNKKAGHVHYGLYRSTA